MYVNPAARATCAAKAARVRDYVEAYRDEHEGPGEPISTTLVDLVADLQHYAAVCSISWQDVTEMAAAHVEAERRGE